jgi:hypothetical protein
LRALVRASAAFTQIARWNLTTVEQLEAAAQFYVPDWILTGQTSRHLAGRDLGDHPDAADRRVLVRAPAERIRELIDVYRAAGAGTWLSGMALAAEPNSGVPETPENREFPGAPDVPGL